MKHSKEWHTCDRCGAEVKPMPGFCQAIRRNIGKLEEIKVIQDSVYACCNEAQELSDGNYAMSIIESHAPRTICFELCPKCRKEFERFMRDKENK